MLGRKQHSLSLKRILLFSDFFFLFLLLLLLLLLPLSFSFLSFPLSLSSERVDKKSRRENMISTFSFLCPSVNLVTAKMYSCARAFVIVIVIVKHLKKMAVHDARRWGKKDSLEIKLFFQRSNAICDTSKRKCRSFG